MEIEITIKGEAKDIAALVHEVQKQKDPAQKDPTQVVAEFAKAYNKHFHNPFVDI